MTGQREIDVVLSSEAFSLSGQPYDIGANLFDALVRPALMQVEEQLPHDKVFELWGGFIGNSVALATTAMPRDKLLLILDTIANITRDRPESDFGPEAVGDVYRV